MSASIELRERTAAAHEGVDAAFGHYDLKDRGGYAAFLVAHTRALPVAEAVMAAAAALPAWRARTPLLLDDLARLERAPDAPLPFDASAEEGVAWGVMYVVEGSRLGGAMLARMVGEGLPTAYLSDGFGPGEWRAMRHAIDEAGAAGGDAWMRGAIRGAEACFALYRRAAA